MTPRNRILQEQREWAQNRGLDADARGYLAEVELNLFKPMTEATRSAFGRGSGSELLDTSRRPAKMKALHSSSALAVNFFDAWACRDGSPLQNALDLEQEISEISFEAQFATGLRGNPPNLDVALSLANGFSIGIESTFTEWLTPKPGDKSPFKEKYFPGGSGLWEMRGLSASESLARMIRDRSVVFRYLDAPQLLKHALGLATSCGGHFSLFYVFLDYPCDQSELHREEMTRFDEIVGAELGFRALTYQFLLSKLAKQSGIDSGYVDYLRDRYCRAATCMERELRGRGIS
ncbi:PGN_0703 family putative restriction endonuclease [Lentisalinibacter sediminis]|uniref:PGN_0703 family putative restriction endonuclease n=1 Tax=Lentisalinibacter sediminis TaxID=2992237 RepID=UPI00386FA8C9